MKQQYDRENPVTESEEDLDAPPRDLELGPGFEQVDFEQYLSPSAPGQESQQEPTTTTVPPVGGDPQPTLVVSNNEEDEETTPVVNAATPTTDRSDERFPEENSPSAPSAGGFPSTSSPVVSTPSFEATDSTSSPIRGKDARKKRSGFSPVRNLREPFSKQIEHKMRHAQTHLPECPTIATVSPGETVKLKSLST